MASILSDEAFQPFVRVSVYNNREVACADLVCKYRLLFSHKEGKCSILIILPCHRANTLNSSNALIKTLQIEENFVNMGFTIFNAWHVETAKVLKSIRKLLCIWMVPFLVFLSNSCFINLDGHLRLPPVYLSISHCCTCIVPILVPFNIPGHLTTPHITGFIPYYPTTFKHARWYLMIT